MSMRECEVEKTCYCCESNFLVLADTSDVEYCPFCGEELEADMDMDEDEDNERE